MFHSRRVRPKHVALTVTCLTRINHKELGVKLKYHMFLVSLQQSLDVLVSPIREAPRFSDLSTEEVSDLFISTQKVSDVIQKEYKATSLSIAIQVNNTQFFYYLLRS